MKTRAAILSSSMAVILVAAMIIVSACRKDFSRGSANFNGFLSIS